MQNFPFLSRFNPDIEFLNQKLKLNTTLTKSSKLDHIYKMGLYMLEEHNCLILTSSHVSKLK